MKSIYLTALTLLLPTTLSSLLDIRRTTEALTAAIVTIEASHGGAGQDLTNLTVEIPLTATYTNRSALAEVSTLYLVDARGVPYDSITCQPFRYANGSGDAGLPFNETSPSFLSTNTVEVGSIVCVSSHISFAPPGPPPGSAPLTTSTEPGGNGTSSTRMHSGTAATSTLVTTRSTGAASEAAASTSTMVVTGGGGSGPSETGTGTASASAALTSGNSASGIMLGSEFFGGLALAGFGIAFAL